MLLSHAQAWKAAPLDGCANNAVQRECPHSSYKKNWLLKYKSKRACRIICFLDHEQTSVQKSGFFFDHKKVSVERNASCLTHSPARSLACTRFARCASCPKQRGWNLMVLAGKQSWPSAPPRLPLLVKAQLVNAELCKESGA